MFVVQIIVDIDCLNGGDAGGGPSTPTNPGTPPINPSAGGGGESPSPNPVVTTPLLVANKTSCQQLNNLINIPEVTSKLTILKNNISGNREKGFLLFDKPSEQTSQSLKVLL